MSRLGLLALGAEVQLVSWFGICAHSRRRRGAKETKGRNEAGARPRVGDQWRPVARICFWTK